MKPGNRKALGPDGAKGARVKKEPQKGNATAAQTVEVASTGLLGIGKVAKQNPNLRFKALAHYLTVELLVIAFSLLHRKAAVGVDQVTIVQYELKLQENLVGLRGRLKEGKYRHQPIRRVNIPKEGGKTRPLGVSCTEDKVVQQALRMVLEEIFEQDFLNCSYGFRPRIGAHDAIRAIDQMVMAGAANWILEADICAYFDSINRKMLMDMLRRRVEDGQLLRLVGKCLHVGVLDKEGYAVSKDGTAQGSILSPLLGNIYLHNVLDEWFAKEVKSRLLGKAQLIRYADDFIIGFEREDDANRVMKVLHQRMEKYGLKLHPEKTRLVSFNRPKGRRREATRSQTFDFLGFTMFWRRTRAGRWALGMKTRKARMKRAIQAIQEFCRRYRHSPVEEQHARLRSRLIGHYNYFGVNGNRASISKLKDAAERAWHKWLNRRSQRARISWERFKLLLKRFALPEPRIVVKIWAETS
jgi:RNA-directed DNA polymerase